MDVLTKEFEHSLKPIGLMFEKPTPKPKRTMYDYAKKAIKNKRLIARPAPKKKKKTRLPSMTKIKKKTWDCFSLFIRNRDKKCVLCGSIKGFSAGHLIPRGKASTCYDENNVFGLCSTCNFRDRFEPGYHDRYVAWYYVKFGAGRYINLVNKSQQLKQRKRIDYEELIKKYGYMAE